MKKTLILAAISLLSSITVAHAAEADYYVGASVGGVKADFDISGHQTNPSESVFVGRKFNETFSAEVGYTHFGKLTLDNGQRGDAHVVGISGVAHAPLFQKLDGYAKIGVAYTKFTDGANEQKFKPSYAVGTSYPLNSKVALTAEVQYIRDFASTSTPVMNTAVGATYKF